MSPYGDIIIVARHIVKMIFVGRVPYGVQLARWNGAGECLRSVSDRRRPLSK
jgi:hypothetical protein